MCHSVEMYLPGMTQRAAEHRIGRADFAAAERERWVVDAGLGLAARLKRLVGQLSGGGKDFTREIIPNTLGYNRNQFGRDLWLGKRESHSRQDAVEAVNGKRARQAGALRLRITG